MSESCDDQCCMSINGGFSNWGIWGFCSCNQAVGTGTRTRSRSCTSPSPSCGGRFSDFKLHFVHHVLLFLSVYVQEEMIYRSSELNFRIREKLLLCARYLIIVCKIPLLARALQPLGQAHARR